MYDLYKSMMISLGEANEGIEDGEVTVEIAERECKSENAVYLRVAFQVEGGGSNLCEIEFRNREQLQTVGKAILKYLDAHGGIGRMLK